MSKVGPEIDNPEACVDGIDAPRKETILKNETWYDIETPFGLCWVQPISANSFILCTREVNAKELRPLRVRRVDYYASVTVERSVAVDGVWFTRHAYLSRLSGRCTDVSQFATNSVYDAAPRAVQQWAAEHPVEVAQAELANARYQHERNLEAHNSAILAEASARDTTNKALGCVAKSSDRINAAQKKLEEVTREA